MYGLYTAKQFQHDLRSAGAPSIWNTFTFYILRIFESIGITDGFALLFSEKMLRKVKLHLLVHLEGHIVAFGPLVEVSTERFESCNSGFRSTAVYSNRKRRSRELEAIARLSTSVWGSSRTRTRLLYNTLVRTILCYGAPIWAGIKITHTITARRPKSRSPIHHRRL